MDDLKAEGVPLFSSPSHQLQRDAPSVACAR